MERIISPKGRVSFPHVLEPNSFNNQEPKYSIQLLLEKGVEEVEEFVKKLQGEIKKAIVAKWPNEETRPKKPALAIKNGDKWETEDGDLKKDKYPEYEGHYVISASSKKKPGLVDKNVNEIMDSSEFYAGCYAKISFNIFAYDNVKRGVSFGLGNVKKVAEGEPLGAGGTTAEEDFGPATGADTGSDKPEAQEDDSFLE